MTVSRRLCLLTALSALDASAAERPAGGPASAPKAPARKAATATAQHKPRAKTNANHAASASAASPYAHRPEVLAWADAQAQAQGWEPSWVRRQLARARLQPAVRRLIMPAPVGQPKNWAAYRERFITDDRVRAGLGFWQRQDHWLARAETRFGVPAEMVVAIVGVETFYGRVMGEFRVLDTLATLAFDFPPGRSDRSAFFRDELVAFLSWCRNEGLDPQGPIGSHAGAIGLPQFMPSSIHRYAIDFDGDGHIDLRGNGADVVGSVARYLAEFGWTPGMPTHYAVEPPPPGEQRAALLGPDIVPSFSAAQFAERGARLDPAAQVHPGLLALVELENGSAPPSYVAGTANFYVVTRYNWSSYYAMAVISLAQALRAARR